MHPKRSNPEVRTLDPSEIASRRAKLAVVGASEPTPSMIWEPVAHSNGRTPTTSEVLNQTRPPELLPEELEAAVIATLAQSPTPGEPFAAHATRRERELGTLFANLSPIQAHHLGRRLDVPRADDALTSAFHTRLTVERRTRLRAFLADARRRACASR